MDPIKVDFSGKGADKSREIVIPPEKSALKIILSLVFALITGAVTYYFMLPPLNFKALELYYFIGIVIASFVIFLGVLSGVFRHTEYVPYIKRKARIPAILIGVLAVVILVGYLVGCQFFRAKRYSEIIEVKDNQNFSADFGEPDFTTIPKLDESASASVAPKALGELADLGLEAQFNVYTGTAASTCYPQINYEQRPVRLAMLRYDNIIKWITNMQEGIPGYIIIDTAKKETRFVALEDPIRYSLADHFGRHVKRVARFAYPTLIFDDPSFEIDDSGKPYFIIPHLDKTIGLFGGRDVMGIVLIDAVTGEARYCTIDEVKTDESLRWIDRVYADDLIVEQYDYFGKYRKGFWNSILGQENCVKTTEGSNYIALDDDVWLYTGVTSVTSDESIVGFVLVNQRTKETRFYRVSGGKETAGQLMAKDHVQEKEYNPSFPILVNIGGEPTYFLSLKGDSETVQLYAMVNVRQYQKVVVTDETISGCLQKYIDALKSEGKDVSDEVESITTPDETDAPAPPAAPTKPAQSGTPVEGVVSEIRSAVIGGNTVYYLRLTGDTHYYSISAADSEQAVILNVGDTIRAETLGGGAIQKLASLTITGE